EHEDVIPQSLEIVRSPVARSAIALVMEHIHLHVGGHLQVAAKAAWSPRNVASVTGHTGVRMGQPAFVLRNAAPALSILEQCLGERSLLIVFRIAGGNGVDNLFEFPNLLLAILVCCDGGALKKFPVFLEEAVPAGRCESVVEQSVSARGGRR